MLRRLVGENWALSGFGLAWVWTCLVGDGPAISEIGGACWHLAIPLLLSR